MSIEVLGDDFPVKRGAIVPSSITGVVAVSVVFRIGCIESEDVVGRGGRGIENARVQ